MEKQERFSIRKLSIGAVSCMIGAVFFIKSGQSVKADTVNDTQTAIEEVNKTVKIDPAKMSGEQIEKPATQKINEQAETSDVQSSKQREITTDNTAVQDNPKRDQQNVTDNNGAYNQQEPVSSAKSKQTATLNIKNLNVDNAQELAANNDIANLSNKQNTANNTEQLQVSKQQQTVPDSAENKLNLSTLKTTAGKKLNAQMLFASKAVSRSSDANGGFDSSWGKLNVNDWKGDVQGDYYQLTDYTGDADHIIVPNEADFAKAGISTSGKQVGVTSDFMHTIFRDKTKAQDATVAFSKTDNKQVKAIGTDWRNTWGHVSEYINFSFIYSKGTLTKFDGSNLDVANVTNMGDMFYSNKISDVSSLANWHVNNVGDMDGMFLHNQISDISSLAKWNVNKVVDMVAMFNENSSIQTKITPANRIINFVYPAGYTGKKQDPVTQSVDVPTEKVKVELTTKDSKPSNNILDWVTKTETPETPETPDPVYFQDYTVPEIKGLLEPDKTVISKQEADITKPINVTVTYKLVDSNTNDAFALDSKNGLHEHINVNVNGGYDSDFWCKINVDDWNYTVNGDTIEINGLKDSASTGTNDAVIVPNLDDFKLAGKDGGAKTVYISKNMLGKTAKHKYYGLSKTNGNTFATDSNLAFEFYNNSNLTHADLNSLNTSNVTDMNNMFDGASSLTSLDVSNWDTGNVTDMNNMFDGASSLTSLDVSNWDTGNVTNMTSMFNGASSLTSLDVSKWDTGNVTNMSYMFASASSLNSLDVSNWKTGNVTDMNGMFNDASGLTSLNVSNWDTSKVTNMELMFYGASGLTSLNVSKWNTDKVTNMELMFDGASSLALIVNDDKFADYLVNHDRFAGSNVDSGVKSVTTDNAKLLQLLTSDAQHNSATRTIVFTFPANYSPDLIKYHLTKVGNTYQIKQSADYDKLYLQGTVLINATDDIAKHHIDMTKPNKLSDTWQPNYDKLVLAHKNADGTISFDKVQLPKIPGYKAGVKTASSPANPASALFAVSFMALPKPVIPAIKDAKPAETFSPATPEAAKPIKTEAKITISATPKAMDLSNNVVTTTPKIIDLSNDAVTTTPKESTWQVANEPKRDTYHVFNGKYTVELPHISNAQLHVIAKDSTKDSVLFTYVGQNSKYVFNIKFVNGHYLLTTYKIKSGKLIKLIDYNFIKSSKMIDVISDWLGLK